ncbi:MAG: hypothetical protein FWD60_00015 [Candidatus Azobacteroides sp.]|nr:hypothetical protein [Candidatus Azobacteroides sp.]
MKRITYKTIIISILLIVNVSVFAQTYNLTGPTGTFEATGAVYSSGPKTIIWNINTSSLKPVKIKYYVDCIGVDFVDIYAVSGSNEYLLRTISSDGCRDSISTGLPTGRAKVQFRIGSTNMGNCGYAGLLASYLEDDNDFVGDNAHINQDLFVLGNANIGTGSSNNSRLQVVGNNMYGIYSTNNGTTGGYNTYGIYSTNNVTNGYNTFGIYSSATSNSTGPIYGLYSYVSGTTPNKWAGYFTGGDVQINSGNLITQNGNLQISNGTLVTQNGNVGIGTTVPQYKLDVAGPISTNGSLILGNVTHQYILSPSWQASDPPMIFIAPKDLSTGSWDWSKQIILKNDGSLLMSAGNLGVGTTVPQSRLEVNGDIRVSGSGDTGNSIIIHNGTKTQPGQAQQWKIWNMTGSFGNSLQFWAYDQTACNGSGLCASRLTLMDNGNVGIGITNPTYKLEVNGSIRAKEVIIDNNNWPDFVFSPNYQLPSLETVSNHIKEYNHLPDIPSVQEVSGQGINLGEMQAKLLQKIEELTLYAIEQNKKIEKLEKEIEKLQNK